MNQLRIPCLLMRGGTKKGAYFLASDLPDHSAVRDETLLAAMGSPDIRQIDGIGGASELSSKVAIVRPSSRPGIDVDYLFAQVQIDEARVDYSRSCGNILAAVGPFAVERALVPVTGAITPVRIFMENTGQIAIAQVHTADGSVQYSGDTGIDGVPGKAAPVAVAFSGIAGSSCGALLPTGNALDLIDGLEVTCVDNGIPIVLVRAQDLALTGYESPAFLDANSALKARLESLRIRAGLEMKLGDVSLSKVPKVCLVAPPQTGGALNTRTFMPHFCHTSIGVFIATSVGAACAIEGSVAAQIAGGGEGDVRTLSIEHPTGEFTVELRLRDRQMESCAVIRTARLLFDGWVCVPHGLEPALPHLGR